MSLSVAKEDMRNLSLFCILMLSCVFASAQRSRPILEEYMGHIQKMNQLSKINSDRIDERSVLRVAKTNDDPNKYVKFCIIRYTFSDVNYTK